MHGGATDRLLFVHIMSTFLNISAIAARTGVAADTLRKWEARHGVLTPERTAGGQRRYTERDVARVEWLRDRLAEGWRIGEAARVLTEDDTPALERPDDLRDALVVAAANDDPVTVSSLLDQVFAVLSPEDAFAQVLTPALREVGARWHRGEMTVAEEHAITGKVRARLEEMLAEQRPSVRGTAVLACAPDERHEIGLLMLAVLLRADGWRVEYLGAATPVAESLAFAASVGAQLVCLSAGQRATATQLRRGLRGLDTSAVHVAIGGAAMTARDADALGVTYTNADLPAAVTEFRALAPR
jgi:methanogenic corrinoid protein MtbC1